MPGMFESVRKIVFHIRYTWKSLLVGMLLCAMAIALWVALDWREKSNLQFKIRSEAEFLSSNIEADLRSRIPSLQRIVKEWESHHYMSRDEFLSESTSYLIDVPGFQALEWVDRNYYVRWIVPFEKNKQALNLNLAFEKNRKNAMEKARTLKSSTVTSPVDLVQGGKGFLMFFPVYVHNSFEGYILAVFRINEWLDFVFNMKSNNDLSENYIISVFFDDIPVYLKGDLQPVQKYDYNAISSTQIIDHNIYVHVYPTEKLISKYKTVIPAVAVIFGVLLSFLLSFIAGLLQKANLQTLKMHEAKLALETEIDERKAIEEKLQRSLVRIDLATKAGGMGIWTWDLSSDSLTWNDRMFDLFDIPSETILTYETWRKTVHPDDLSATERLLMNSVKRDVVFNTEFRIVLRDGSIRNIRAASRTVMDIDHNPQYVTGLNWDVTDNRRAKESLKEREEQVRLLLNSTGEAIYGINMQGDCTFANPSCARMLGYSDPGLLIGKNMHTLIHHSYADGKPMVVENCRIYCAINQGKSMHVDDEVLWRADGTSFPVEYWSYPQKAGDIITGAVVTFIDISERKKAEELLAMERRRLSYILEGTNAGTWEWNVQTGETLFNRRWAEIAGYTLEELSPVTIKTWENLIHPEDAVISRKLLEKHFNHESDYYECEVRMHHKNGTWVWILDRGKVATWDMDYKPLLMAETHTDITEKKEAEERILNARDMAEAANNAKSTFLANMSHDLRTPMNAIIGISGVLVKKYDNSNKRFKEGLQLIHESGERLLTLINDLLDLSRIESQKMDVSNSWFKVQDFVPGIYATMSALIGKRKITFAFETEDMDKYIYNDKNKIYRILMNLLGNAAKFTREGSILLKVKIDSEKTVFEVIDTGIGINEKQLQYIFEPFYQADNSMTREYTGSGLGLALCKSMAELMNGIIEVESEPGKGTTVCLLLPVIRSQNMYYDEMNTGKGICEDSGSRLTISSKRILIVDDESMGRETLKYMLENIYKLSLAENGSDAVELFKNNNYDIVLLDIIMPGMGGYKVFEEFRKININIPVIAVTARAMPQDKIKILECGFAAFISKPVNQDELIETIESFN